VFQSGAEVTILGGCVKHNGIEGDSGGTIGRKEYPALLRVSASDV